MENSLRGLLSEQPQAAVTTGASGLLGDAPYGAIVLGDKVILGSPHGGSVELSPNLKKTVSDVANRYGAYYEGDGKDVGPLAGLLGKKSYKGSWDDVVESSVEGYPTEFLSGLFSNTEANNYHNVFADPKRSIFDSLLSNQNKARYFKNKEYDASTLQNFLNGGSQDGVNFAEMSNLPATEENLKKFFNTGEQLMWPDNWQEYPNNLGKFAKKFEEARNKALLNAPPGVYVAGAGHLPELASMDKNIRLIGGEKASQ